MRGFGPRVTRVFAVVTILLGACAQQAPVMRPPPPALITKIQLPEPSPEREPEWIDLMADVEGDRMLPVLSGEIERIDCKTGIEDLHARMAVEARGGQIASFAYYSKWRPRTCSLEMKRDDPETKWRLTPDGATRVQTPHGLFLIRVEADAYVFEFQDVERGRFCGMDGHTNGTMGIKRRSAVPECTVAGLLDRDDDPAPLRDPAGHGVLAAGKQPFRAGVSGENAE